MSHFSSTHEIPSGTINGINKVFTTTKDIDEGLIVFWNGIACPAEDTIFGFSVTGAREFTLITAPEDGDSISCYYITT